VSPFDVFDKPKSTPKPSPPAPAQKKKEEEKPIPDLPASKRNGVASTAASSSPKKQTSPSKPASRAVMEASALGRQPSSSSISSAASGSSKQDLGLVWQVSKVVGKGVKGQGPKRLSAHTVIDLSKPNVNSLVNSPGSVQVAPFTIMKAESVGFTQGRTVGITASWVAYALPKGMSS
jgi:hypothetical protein